MEDKAKLVHRIYELDFALYELTLFLDSHPTSSRALELIGEYRDLRSKLIEEYEEKYGKYVLTHADVPLSESWQWLEGPWPWDTDFTEG